MKKNIGSVFSDPVLFLLSTVLVLLLLLLHVSYSTLQIISVILLLISLFVLQHIERATSYNQVFPRLLIFCLTLSVQLLTVSTGGLTSHFLLIAALFAFALSFIKNMITSFVFLFLFVIPLGTQLLLDNELREAVSDDPTVLLLFLLVYVFATIFSYILNTHYHVKDVFLEVLQKQVNLHEIREETILSDLHELIIITDRKLNIISVNNAVEKVITIPKSELIGKPIFAYLLLKNEEGKLLSESELSINKLITEKKPITAKNVMLLIDHGSKNTSYTLTIKPINELEGKVDQVLFIVRNDGAQIQETRQHELFLDQVITKHTALIEGMKRNLQERGMPDLASKAELIGKIDREIRQLLVLEREDTDIVISPVNAALVSRSTTEAMKTFSQVLGVTVDYVLLDVDAGINEKHKKHNDEIEESIRNLYSVSSNLFWLEVLLHKLIEIAILLSSTADKKQVTVSLKRVDSQLLLTVRSYNTQLNETNKSSLFTINYDDLQSLTNLSLASGLEGYISQKLSKLLTIPIALHVQDKEISFTLLLATHPSA